MAGADGRRPRRGGDGDEAGEENPVAVVIYTSGTTSEPKGVLLRHQNLVSYVLGSVEFASAGETEAALVSVPPYHIAAVANVITNLYAGRRALVLEAFTPGEWLRVVREEEVTSAMVVPTMLARIIECEGDRSVPSLRALSYGGAPMPAALIERALREWARVDFVNAYGLTETSSTVALLGPEDHRAAWNRGTRRCGRGCPRSASRCPGRTEIRGPGGKVLGAGQACRICVRGDQVSAEYAGVGRAVDDRGFFDTRDDGYLDEEGYLFVSGRADDTIIRGAENIAPAEIEDVLLRHPAVLDAAVFGVPDQEWGQRIEAAVVPRPEADIDPAELRDFTFGPFGRARPPTVSGCSTRCRAPRPASCCAARCPAWSRGRATRRAQRCQCLHDHLNPRFEPIRAGFQVLAVCCHDATSARIPSSDCHSMLTAFAA